MAEKRMFAKTIISSDAFLTMSHTAQCLYFQLSMNADDDGLLNNSIMIIRLAGCSQKDFDELLEKNFILSLGRNIYAIKHWHMNNYIRNDRKRDSVYKEEVSKLTIKENGAYSLRDIKEDSFDEEDDYIEEEQDSSIDTSDSIEDEGNSRDIDEQQTDSSRTHDITKTDSRQDVVGQLAGSWQADDGQMTDNSPPDDRQQPAQSRIDKDRVDKSSLNITHTSKLKDKQKNKQTDKEDARVEESISSSVSDPRKDYAQSVFDILFTNNLPCCNNNFLTFLMRDFKLGLTELAALHIHSDDVIQAVKNYAEVIALKRQGKSWWESELNFYTLCKNKTILRFLPGDFDLDSYRKSKGFSARNESGELPQGRSRL